MPNANDWLIPSRSEDQTRDLACRHGYRKCGKCDARYDELAHTLDRLAMAYPNACRGLAGLSSAVTPTWYQGVDIWAPDDVHGFALVVGYGRDVRRSERIGVETVRRVEDRALTEIWVGMITAVQQKLSADASAIVRALRPPQPTVSDDFAFPPVPPTPINFKMKFADGLKAMGIQPPPLTWPRAPWEE